MKIIFNCLFLLGTIFSIYAADEQSSDTNRHLPWCGGPGDHVASTDCYGYACALAYNRGDSHLTCPSLTAPLGGSMSGEYFQCIYLPKNGNVGITTAELDSLVGIEELVAGTLLRFNDHLTYVKSINPSALPIESGILLREKPDVTQAPGDSYLDDWLDSHSGQIIQALYARTDNWDVLVHNSFDDGHIGFKANNSYLIYNNNQVTSNHELIWEGTFNLYAVHNNLVFEDYKRIFWFWWCSDGGDYDYEVISENHQVIHRTHTERPTWTAEYRKELNFSFANHFVGRSDIGKMVINGQEYAETALSGTVFHRVQDIQIPYNFNALGHQYSSINYNFDHWETNPPSATQNPYSMYQQTSNNQHVYYTAHFVGKPTQVQNLQNIGSLNMPIHLVWNIHPNVNVSYKIWRRVRDQWGNETGPDLVGTRSHYSNSFVDYDFSTASSYILLIRYDVRAYYSIENSSVDEHWYGVFGNYLLKSDSTYIGSNLSLKNIISKPELAVFPNPFNPETNIVWTMPESGNITIKIYDVSGRIVKRLLETF